MKKEDSNQNIIKLIALAILLVAILFSFLSVYSDITNTNFKIKDEVVSSKTTGLATLGFYVTGENIKEGENR